MSYKPIIVGMPTRPSLIQSCSYYEWLASLNWAPIPPSCPHPNFSQTPSCALAIDLVIFHFHLILSFAWSISAADEPSIGASSGRVSDSKVTLVTPLVEVVSIDVTVMDGIWADMLALQKVVLIEILTNNHPL